MLTLPTSCQGPLQFGIEEIGTWQEEYAIAHEDDPVFKAQSSVTMHNNAGEPVGITGCEKLVHFQPTIEAAPGGLSIGFYASLRLRCHSPQRIRREREIAGEKQKRVSGVQTMVEVYKSSVWDPYHAAPVHIQFDYGIDDIRGNLEYLKANVGGTVYALGERRLGASIERAIKTVEDAGLEDDLRRRVVEVWHDVEGKFKVERTAKRRG